MEPLYSETYLRANPTMKRRAARIALIVLAVFLVAFGFLMMSAMQTPIVLTIMVIVDVIILFFLPTNQIAYEYIFVDGQIDFDRILKGEKRKTMKRIDMEKVEVVAPVKSHALDAFQRDPIFDYSSGMEGKHYIAVFLGEKGREQIKFTPDEKMLEMIGRKAPSKLKKE